jgi:hypothetical protein
MSMGMNSVVSGVRVRMKHAVYLMCALFILFCLSLVFTHTLSTPRNDRDWTVDQQVLPVVSFGSSTVTIKNVRNFEYTDEFTYTPEYYNRTYKLDEISSLDFIVVPLAKHAVAHTFLTFGFAGGEYVSISVEVRKEKGEVYSAMKGLFDQYELMYVIADERDVLRLRGIHRDNEVYLYPAHISQEKIRELFVSMLTRAQSLESNPEFYNTITSSCTTNIVSHINAISDTDLAFDVRTILPKNSDALAYELGFINTELPFDELRALSEISDKIRLYGDNINFSQLIRESVSINEITD